MKMKINIFLLISLFLLNNMNAKENNFLHFDLKKDCPNPKISSLGILISLSELDDSSYENTLNQEERNSYEEMIQLKRSFSSTMSYIPQSFYPEKKQYQDELDYLLVVFIIIAIFPMFFIIFYLFIRFCLKKCTGPKKLNK